MDQLTSIETIATVIQLAVAPVFLLAGIAGLLNVLSIRLGRVVDRVRVVETRLLKKPTTITARYSSQRQILYGTEFVWSTGRFVPLWRVHS